MSYRKLTTVGLMYILIMCSSNLAMSPFSEQVYNFIFTNYTKDIRPNADEGVFTVQTKFGILTISNFDEVSGMLTIICYVNQQWFDTRLSWNMYNFGNVSYITVPQDNIWLPKLFLLNPSNELKALSDSDFKVNIWSTGWIVWVTGGVLKSLCTANVKYFPFDIQRCTLHLFNWGFNSGEIYLEPDEEVNMEFFKENGEWSIKTVKLLTDKSGTWLKLNISMERNSLRITVNVILPFVFLSILNPIVFLLPAESGERMSFGITIFLSYAIFMTLINQEMPKTSNPLPLLSVTLITNLSFSAIIIILNVILLRLHAGEDENVPNIVARIFKPVICNTKISDTVSAQPPTCIEETKAEKQDEAKSANSRVKGGKYQMISWKKVGTKCEFYCFILCTTVAIVLNITFILAMKGSSN